MRNYPTNLNIKLENMGESEIAEVVKLITKAMNKDEGRWAKKTMDIHFFCARSKRHDGRNYYVAKLNKKIVGIVGLHHYIWGPKEIVWLGWFAVSPNFQGRGIGKQLMKKIFQVAKHLGYKKIFVETYSTKEFFRARSFYKKFGFEQVGKIKDYLEKNKDMIIFRKNI